MTFTDEQAWPDPGQRPYDVSNMDFFDELAPFVADFVFPQEATEPHETIEETVTAPAPGAGTRSPATSGWTQAFELDEAQGLVSATVESASIADPDIYLQVQDGQGNWNDVASGETGRTGLETLEFQDASPGTYRLEVHAWAGSGPADVTIEFEGMPAVTNPSDYDADDLDALVSELQDFVEGGGNLVLTDDSLRALEWLGLVPDGSVSKQLVYAGHVEFTDDQGTAAPAPATQAAGAPTPATGGGLVPFVAGLLLLAGAYAARGRAQVR